jgi:hypothetical protein
VTKKVYSNSYQWQFPHCPGRAQILARSIKIISLYGTKLERTLALALVHKDISLYGSKLERTLVLTLIIKNISLYGTKLERALVLALVRENVSLYEMELERAGDPPENYVRLRRQTLMY